jgi:hypothetical protein
MFVTVLTPLILAGYALLGAASALGGAGATWLFHHLVGVHKLKALSARIEALEK